MKAGAHDESRDAPVCGVSLPAVVFEKGGAVILEKEKGYPRKEGALSVFRCPSPVGYLLVCLSADEQRLILVMLFSAWCFISELVHISVDKQADGEVAALIVVVSTVEAVLADTAVAEGFVRIIVVFCIDSFPPCS